MEKPEIDAINGLDAGPGKPVSSEGHDDELGLATIAVRGGHERTPEGEHAEPLFLSSSYVFDDAAQGEQRMAMGGPGNVYTRYTNPTVRIFEQRLAKMELAEDAVATASGMAAILSTCMTFLQAGDHMVCSRDVFGSTRVLLDKYLSKFGVDVSYVALTDLDQWRDAVKKQTKILFLETPSNPLNEVADLSALAELANAVEARLVVDNCFCTPVLQQPLSLGAHMVLHSATKYIDGQGRCLGGVVAGSGEDMEEVRGFIRACGPAMSPFNAWVFLKGLETLKIRMRAHSEGALQLAVWLEQQQVVEKVFYAGLESHKDHHLARSQQSGFSGVLSFRVAGSREQAWKVIDACRFLSITPNLGDAKTTIVHPATTTHGRLSDQQRADAGISENLIRISVGLEDIEDIQADLYRGLSQLSGE